MKNPKSTLLIALVLVFSFVQLKSQTNEIRKQNLVQQMKDPTWSFKAISDTFDVYFAKEHEEISIGAPHENSPDEFEDKGKRWLLFYKDRCMYPGAPAGGSIKGAIEYLKSNNVARCTTGIAGYNWVAEGPFEDASGLNNVGLVSRVAVDPTSPNIIYLGTNHAGVWKSTNGGATWANLTDYLNIPDLCVGSIDVDPKNPSRILVGFGLTDYPFNSAKAMESFNGGLTWNQITLGGIVQQQGANIGCVKYHPYANYTFVSFGNNLYRRDDNQTNQTFMPVAMANINLDPLEEIYTLEFPLNLPNIVYAATNNPNVTFQSGGKALYSTNTGQSFSQVQLHPFKNQPTSRMGIDVINANPNELYAFYINQSSGPSDDYVLAVTSNFGSNWTILNVTPRNVCDNSILNTPIWGGWSDGFEVLDNQPGKFLISNEVIVRGDWLSTNNNIYSQVSDYWPGTSPGVNAHCDIRFMHHYFNGNTNTEWMLVGCDGGIIKSTDGGTTWVSINGQGLNVSQYYCVSSFQGNGNLIASSQDNFVQKKIGALNTWNVIGNWQNGGDSYWNVVDYTNDEHFFMSAGDWIYETYTGGATWNDITAPYNSTTPPPNVQISAGRFFADPTKPGVIWCGTWGVANTFSYNPANQQWTMAWTQNAWPGCSVPSMDQLAIAPTNSNCIYEGHSGINWNTACQPTNYRLFKKGVFSNNLPWNDITYRVRANPIIGDLFTTTGITSICVDPLNENRVFLSFGQYYNLHVIRSTDGGTNWTDMSNGLPPVNVNQLIYQNGTDDVLYAATDLGVYKWNAGTGIWECFNLGMPPAVVKSIEINYCRNKLYIATQGRGAYSCNLPPTPTYKLTVPKVQAANGNSSSVLTLPKYYNQIFANSISVEAGVILNQQGIMRFNSTSSLIIKKGARVNLTGTLTTLCDQMWKGVQLEGTTNVYGTFTGQLSNNQGILDINNQGTIMHADIGVFTGVYNFLGQDIWGSHGGIILANNANFIDNKKDIAFMYHDKPNQSKFINCNFETRDKLPGGVNPEGHVSMHAVSNIFFQGCDFRYTALGKYPTANRGYGIYSLDAKYNVVSLCNSNVSPCTNFDRSTFQDLTRGIYSYATDALNTAVVNECIFTGIIKDDAYFLAINNVSFTNNRITMPSATLGYRSGVYLENCKKYLVSNNTIAGANINQDYGIIARKSNIPSQINGSNHYIYKNTIDKCITAVASQQENADLNYTGLKVKCNLFGTINPNAWDVTQLGGSTARVDRYQGTNPSNTSNLSRLVGNNYNSACWGGSENRWYVDNSVPNTQATQVLHFNNAGSNYKVDGLCSALPLFYFNTQYNYLSSQCPNISGNISPVIQSQNIATHESNYISVLNNENTIIDGGNSQSLLSVVNSGTTSSVIKNTLLTNSPYLSDAVMIAYFSNTVFPAQDLIDVHAANSPVTESVWQVLNSRNFTGTIQALLNSNQSQTAISARETLEIARHEVESDLGLAYTQLLSYFLTDTILTSQDSVLNLLSKTPFADSKCLDVSHRISLGYLMSSSQIDIIHGGNGHVDSYCQFQKIKCTLPDTAKDFRSLKYNLNLRSQLEAIAQSQENDGYGLAKSALGFILDTIYDLEYLLPPMIGQRVTKDSIQSEEMRDKIVDSDYGVIIFPNPTKGELTIKFEQKRALSAILLDVSGRKVEAFKVNSANFTINFGDQPAGIYILRLQDEDGLKKDFKILLSN